MAELPNTFIGWVAFLGLVLGAVAFLLGTWRRGRANALAVAHEELETIEVARKRLAEDLTEARVKCAEDIAFLSGKVERLEAENTQQAERLAMLSPEVLIAAMGDTAKANREFYEGALREALHPIQQGLSRLLAEGS